jgi:hypothetical protein
MIYTNGLFIVSEIGDLALDFVNELTGLSSHPDASIRNRAAFLLKTYGASK